MMWAARTSTATSTTTNAQYSIERFSPARLGDSRSDDVLDREFLLRERMSAQLMPSFVLYDALTERVPSQYHLPTQTRGGTIGIRHRDPGLEPGSADVSGSRQCVYAALACLTAWRRGGGRRTAQPPRNRTRSLLLLWALRECVGGHARVFLIDLPASMLYGCAYLSCVAGPDAIGIVTPDTRRAIDKPFVLIPNVPRPPLFAVSPPAIDLVHNAISLERDEYRASGLLPRVHRRASRGGRAFHLSGGQRVLDSHIDAQAEAIRHFPKLQDLFDE